MDSSSKAVEQTMDKVDQMDIESLNNAISDLNDVVAPMAEFFRQIQISRQPFEACGNGINR